MIGNNEVPFEELVDFDEYRKKKFTHINFCPKCVRSFDSFRTNECKFCQGPVTVISRKPIKKMFQFPKLNKPSIKKNSEAPDL